MKKKEAIKKGFLKDNSPPRASIKETKMEQGKYGKCERGAYGVDMVNLVVMTCGKCGKRINYEVKDSCAYCGNIVIVCEHCDGVSFSFGE